ncbi:MAG: hypothetical protein ACPGXZ_10650 [Saprospiraceae bacterium]
MDNSKLHPSTCLALIQGININNIVNLINAGLAVTVSSSDIHDKDISKLSQDADKFIERLKTAMEAAAEC